MEPEKGANICSSIMASILTVALIGAGINKGISKYYSQKDSRIQSGYVNPRHTEVESKDLDGDGKLETVLRIDDKPYLLKDVNGRPRLSPYAVRVVETQYQQ